MRRRSLILIGLFLAGALATLGYSYFGREQVDVRGTVQRLAAAPAQSQVTEQQTPAAQTPSAAESTPPAEEAVTPKPVSNEDRVSQLIAETSSNDARTRADAITALGDAPRARALPALANVVSAENSLDVPLAMHSLRRLASKQGDADEGIRTVVRKVIYHGSDDTLSSVAQATLSDIEGDLSRRAELPAAR